MRMRTDIVWIFDANVLVGLAKHRRHERHRESNPPAQAFNRRIHR
jgi:hypothetical protein